MHLILQLSTTKSLNQLFKKMLHMTPTEFRVKYAGNRVVLPNFEIITEGKEEDTSRLYSLALQILEQYIEKYKIRLLSSRWNIHN